MMFSNFLRGSDVTEGAREARTKPLPVYLTSTEAANLMRISPRTLEKMRLEKRGPGYFRLGKSGRSKVIYSLSEVTQWMEDQKAG